MPTARLCPPDSTGPVQGLGLQGSPPSQGLPTRASPDGTLHRFLAEFPGCWAGLGRGVGPCLPGGFRAPPARGGRGTHRSSPFDILCPGSVPHCAPFTWQGPWRCCLCPRVHRTPHREPQGSEDLRLSRLWLLGQSSVAETLALWGHSWKSGPIWPGILPRLFHLERQVTQ